MRVGVPKEIKVHEYRVALTPAGARELRSAGHDVIVEAGAGDGAGFGDEQYAAEGARVVPTAADVFDEAELIVKVKEPQPSELVLLRPHHLLFTYLHLAADAALARGVADTGATCVAYETIEDAGGRLPLLAPMSEVAGRIAAQAAAQALERPNGGRGMLLGGVPGVPPAVVVVVGGGVVGTNAALIASGMRAEVHVLDRSVARLRALDDLFDGRVTTHYASELALEALLPRADAVIGAVLVHGARAPHVVRRSDLALMRRGAVLVDVAIDQGGCFETSRATTHADPVYEVDGIVHYCVANMPGAVPVSSTHALTNATLPYVLALAAGGPAALLDDPGWLKGLNAAGGELTCAPVAAVAERPYVEPERALAGQALPTAA